MADPTPSPSPAPTPAPTPAPAFDWGQHGLQPDDLGWVQNKGYKTPADAILAHRSAEKLLGVPADQIVKLPGANAKPEDWNPVFDRLGRPARPDDYGLPVPQGQKDDFAKAAATWFHEAGLSKTQAAKLAEKWNAHVAAEGTKSVETYNAGVAADTVALKGEWKGDAYNANIATAQKAAQAFGIDKATIDKLENAMGFAATMKFMHTLGSKLGTDDTFIAGDKGGGGVKGTGSQVQAMARIAELSKDKAWVARYAKGDVEARNEMMRLNQVAYPGDTEFNKSK